MAKSKTSEHMGDDLQRGVRRGRGEAAIRVLPTHKSSGYVEIADATSSATNTLTRLRRRVRATAEEIFDLWTKPDLMVRWMSPFPGAVDCKASCDLRPGGAFSLVMSSKESSREVSGTYLQVDRPRKLVFTWIGPLTNDVNTFVSVELYPRGDETDLVLTHERLPTPAIVEGHTRGWGNILDHLADTVSKDL